MEISNTTATSSAPGPTLPATDDAAAAIDAGGVDGLDEANLWGDSPPATLTPELVVAMLFQQLRGMDSQIQDRVGEMTESLKKAEKLSAEIADLKALAAQLSAKPAEEQKLKPTDEVTMPSGEEVTVAEVLERSGAGYLASNEEITLSSVQSAIEAKTTELSRFNSGKEQSLIQMQSNLQARQQIITMATQMLNAIHQPMNQIANNIGR